MTRRWFANASPLILLGKVGQASLIAKLCDELTIPERVASEVGAKPEGQEVLDELAQLESVRFEGDRTLPPEIEAWDLGPGESQVIALAARHSGARAVLDDLDARRCARSVGVSVIGTLGVVLRARRRGIIPSARSVLVAL